MLLSYTIKDQTTGEYLLNREYHRYGMAETVACQLTRKSQQSGENHIFLAVDMEKAREKAKKRGDIA